MDLPPDDAPVGFDNPPDNVTPIRPKVFEFTYDENGGITAEAAINQALSAAGLCWSTLEAATWNADLAGEIADELLAVFNALCAQVAEQARAGSPN